MSKLLRTSLGVTAGLLVARPTMAAVIRRNFAKGAQDIANGDSSSMLAGYADDAVIHFHPGTHRFAGDWSGKAAISGFLQDLVEVRLQGTVRDITVQGPPWAMKVWVLVEFRSDADDGTTMYENRTVLLLHTRWGKIVEQHDFYMDSSRLDEFEKTLTKRGINSVNIPAA